MSKSKPRKICGYMGCERPVGPDAYGKPRVRCLEHAGKHIFRHGKRINTKAVKPAKTAKPKSRRKAAERSRKNTRRKAVK